MTSTIRQSLVLAAALGAAAIAFGSKGESSAPATSSCCAPKESVSCCGTAEDCGLVKQYVPISEALAGDDLAKAREAAVAFAEQAEQEGAPELVSAARSVAAAENLSAARAAFKSLSEGVITKAKGAKGVVVMTCPMAKGDWVQTDENVRNPYYGKMMLRCGMVKPAAAPQS